MKTFSEKRIAISTTSYGEYDAGPLDLLKVSGYQVVLNSVGRTLKEDEVVSLAKGAVGLIAGTEPLNQRILGRLTDLRVISRCGVGMDNVDLEAARALGIVVLNTPEGPTMAVAELTLGLILSLLRKVPVMNSSVKAGGWKKQMGNLLFGKNVGVIGFGRIGQKVAELLSAFSVSLAYCDVEWKACRAEWSRMELDEILGWADIITLNLSPAKGNMPLIGREQVRRMRKGSWLINVSRGGVVDEQALYESLKNGQLAGAAIDVFDKEPYQGPLRELENVILTPHIGSYARESRITMEVQAVENLLTALAGC